MAARSWALTNDVGAVWRVTDKCRKRFTTFAKCHLLLMSAIRPAMPPCRHAYPQPNVYKWKLCRKFSTSRQLGTLRIRHLGPGSLMTRHEITCGSHKSANCLRNSALHATFHLSFGRSASHLFAPSDSVFSHFKQLLKTLLNPALFVASDFRHHFFTLAKKQKAAIKVFGSYNSSLVNGLQTKN